jgi:hypothetical protein
VEQGILNIDMYILFTGAPGSKWSSVVKNIYWSDDLDHTDYSEARTYYHDADTPGTKQLMHTGAYWDPGMEFRATPDNWDLPFSGTGKRLIKSHTFAHELDHLKDLGHPIVMVYRNDYECMEWWKLCGEFTITYPNYQHFVNLDLMWDHIQTENKDTMQFIHDNSDKITSPSNNVELCKTIGIAPPKGKHQNLQDYKQKGIQVYVYK